MLSNTTSESATRVTHVSLRPSLTMPNRAESTTGVTQNGPRNEEHDATISTRVLCRSGRMSKTCCENDIHTSDACRVNIKNGHRAEARDLRMRNQAWRAQKIGRPDSAKPRRKCTEKTQGAEPSG
eukprot:8276810-Karenia_brevis.AAC.1